MHQEPIKTHALDDSKIHDLPFVLELVRMAMVGLLGDISVL